MRVLKVAIETSIFSSSPTDLLDLNSEIKKTIESTAFLLRRLEVLLKKASGIILRLG